MRKAWKKKGKFAAVLLAGPLFVMAMFAAQASATQERPGAVFDRTVPLASGGRFELDNVNGSVEVTGWDRDAVEVHAVKMAPDADVSPIQVDVTSAPDHVTVTTVQPRLDPDDEVAVAYSVRVPQHVLLRVATVNGSVRVNGVVAVGQLHAVNGDINVSDAAGALSAQTTNGDVHMEIARLASAGELALETVNGSIVLALPPDSSAALDVRTFNGDFRSELPIVVDGAYKPRELRGRLGHGATPVRLRTVNGAIRIVALNDGV